MECWVKYYRCTISEFFINIQEKEDFSIYSENWYIKMDKTSLTTSIYDRGPVSSPVVIIWNTGWPRNYRKSVLQFSVSVLGRLSDLQYIFAVTYGPPSTSQCVESGSSWICFGGPSIRIRNLTRRDTDPEYNCTKIQLSKFQTMKDTLSIGAKQLTNREYVTQTKEQNIQIYWQFSKKKNQ